MAAENVLATQVTLGLLGSGVLNMLKQSKAVSFFHQNSPVLNHVFLLATSAAGAIGVHTAWNASQHSLTITGLDFATIVASLWIWAKQWAIQFLVHRGAFGPVATNGATPVANPVAAGVQQGGAAKPLARMRLAHLGVVWLALVAILGVLMFSGCAAGKYSAANVNQTVTMVIADAGTVAIQAEQNYQAGKIPQTTAARSAINDLGNAYNVAKDVYSDVLTAEAVYNASQLTQVNACQPASTQGGVVPDPAKCASATTAATKAKASLDAAQTKLSDSLSALTTKTNAVKSLSPQ